MNRIEFMSLGRTKQLKCINNLLEINKQKQALIVELEKENKSLLKKGATNATK